MRIRHLLLLLQAAPATNLGVEFRAPPGWESVESPPLRVFAPLGLAPGELIILTVWPAEKVTGPDAFAGWFERKLTGPGETVQQQSPLDRRPANGLDVLTRTQRVSLPQGGPVVRVVYGIAAGERVALATLTSNQDQLVTRYANVAREFFESLRFPEPTPVGASFTAIPPAGFAGREPRGLFYRLQPRMGTGQMETRTLIFLPSNRLLRLYPFGGGDRVDPARCNPNMCGSYRMESGALTVRWDNGELQRFGFARSGDGLTLDGDTYHPAHGLDQPEAVGNWVNPGGISAGLRFSADGTFEWGAGSRETTLRGRYQIQGLTLILRFTDGTTRSYTLFAAGRSRPVGLISFDESLYSRKTGAE